MMITVMDDNDKEIVTIYDADFIAAHKEGSGIIVVIKPAINIKVVGGVWYCVK